MRIIEIECDQCGEAFTHEVVGSGRVPKRCINCRLKDPKGRDPEYVRRKERTRLVARCTPGDAEMIDYIEKTLGVTQGEAIRTSIRVYYAILTQRR